MIIGVTRLHKKGIKKHVTVDGSGISEEVESLKKSPSSQISVSLLLIDAARFWMIVGG